MTEPLLIDLFHLGAERVIGAYLLDTAEGPALFDCGPATTIDALKAGLAQRGLELTDVRHLLLSHIQHGDEVAKAGKIFGVFLNITLAQHKAHLWLQGQ